MANLPSRPTTQSFSQEWKKSFNYVLCWLTLWLNSEAHPICIQLFSDVKYRSSYSLHHETASQSDHVIYHSVEVRRDFRASAACSHTVVSPYSWKRSESVGKLFWNSGLSNWQTTFIVLLIISVVLRCANTAVSTIHQVSATCGNECQRSSYTTTLINKSIVNWSSLLHPPLSHSKDSKDDPLVQPQNETANQGIIQGSSTFDCKIIKKKANFLHRPRKIQLEQKFSVAQ